MTQVYTVLERNVILDKQDQKIYIELNDEDTFKRKELPDEEFENYKIGEWIKYNQDKEFNTIINKNFGENNYTHYDDYSNYEKENYLWILTSN